jgi:hypothetical protein
MKHFNSILAFLRFNKRNWKAVVLCIFAATVFWFLNAFNKTYTTNINFPLTFHYDQKNFVPVKSLPRHVRINVTGNGWDLFRRSTGVKVSPLEIPLERPAETKKIVGSTLPAFFSNQLEGLEINFVLSDTIYVDLEPKSGRWVHLKLDSVSNNLKKGYGIASAVTIMPDSVFIQGPKPIVEKFQDPLRISLPYNNIDDQFMEDVEVKIPASDLVRRDPPTVAVMFNVDKMITFHDSIRLVMINIPHMAWPVIGRKEIPIVVSVPQNMRDQYTMDSARAILDLKDLPRGERVIVPRVAGLPPFTKVVQIDSVKIKF